VSDDFIWIYLVETEEGAPRFVELALVAARVGLMPSLRIIR
jgi:hypothetical protein